MNYQDRKDIIEQASLSNFLNNSKRRLSKRAFYRACIRQNFVRSNIHYTKM